MTNKTNTIAITFALIASAGFAGGCAGDTDEPINEELAGMESPVAISALATYSAAGGLNFASADAAAQWTEEAPGVWLHNDGEQRLIIGEDGHRWSVAELTRELDELIADGSDADLIVAKEAELDSRVAALSKVPADSKSAVSCSIGLYTGPSSPLTGYTGGAAVAQLSCQGGTEIFTVDTYVCAGSSGCNFSSQTAIPSSTPALWGQARSGYGSCYSDVYVAPPYVGQSSSYTCN